MDIRRLTHFIALAEEGRFAAAAKRCHLSQAAFSRSIQSLESRLGMQLVDRNPEGASLTPTGAAVLARARTLVFDSDCLARDVALLKSGDAGELAIGAAPIPTATLLPELLVRMKRERPQVSIRLHFGNLPQLLPLMDSQQLDFCLGDPRLVPASERIARARVGKVFGSLWCRKGHPAMHKRNASAELLRACGVGSITITRELMAPIARGFGFASPEKFPMTMQCDDVKLLAQIAAATDLLVILPDSPGAFGADLHRLPWKEARAQFADVHALWLAGRTLSPAARFAINAAQEIGKTF
jgi:DNA-binding transcriptional LysR family regulator